MNVYIELLLKIATYLNSINDDKAIDLLKDIKAVINQDLPLIGQVFFCLGKSVILWDVVKTKILLYDYYRGGKNERTISC